MKTIVLIFFIFCSMYIFSCKNNETTNDTSTEMPGGGYKERTDTLSTIDSNRSEDRGAVALDTIKNGQAVISGATSADSSR